MKGDYNLQEKYMRPMATVRKWQFDQLGRHVAIVQFMIRKEDNQRLTHAKEKANGWTAAEVIGHLLDCEKLFLQRAKMTLEIDSPLLPFPPQDDEVRKGNYNDCDPRTTLNEWNDIRKQYISFLEKIPETSWGREGRHPQYDPFSLNDQLALACRHTIQHMEQIVRILVMNDK
jgi:hypothetical protein